MKKSFKVLSIAVSSALVLSTGITAFAAAETISTERNIINIEVNGKKVESDNYLINDRTYIPLRAVSEMLGKNVLWDEATSTAAINDDFSVQMSGDVVGKVNETEIKSELLNGYVNYLKTQSTYAGADNATLTAAAKSEIVKAVILRELAQKYGLFVDSSFNQSYANQLYFIQLQKGGEAAYRTELLSLGYTDNFLRYIKEVSYLRSKVMEAHPYDVTAADVEKYYNDHYEDFKFNGYTIKYIKAPFGEDKAAAKTAIDAYYASVQSGTAFDTVADSVMLTNKDNASKSALISKTTSPDTLESMISTMTPGTLSAPFEYNNAYYIVTLVKNLDHMDFDNGSVKDMIYGLVQLERVDAETAQKVADVKENWN